MTGKRLPRRIRNGVWGTLAFLACTGFALVVWRAWPDGIGWQKPPERSRNASSPNVQDSLAESRIVAFCSDCHPMPRPESFPRDRWHKEVQIGYEFYARSGRNDLDPPPMRQTVAWYRSRAPQEVLFSKPKEAETPLGVKFSVDKLPWTGPKGQMPEIAHMRLARLAPDTRPLLLLCDMRFGNVWSVDVRHAQPYPKSLARLKHPCHIEPCDLDQDGNIDLIVADLGSSRPSDHDRGRVVWLRSADDSSSMEEIVLASGLGRVADVRPADFDADGRLDLVVAEFGHYQTGRILLLENLAASKEPPRFEIKVLDQRPGTIHVPVHDFDGDRRLDFVALISQEWEHVEAFLSRPGGRFDRRVLWAGPDLTFGSSGIELFDLDRDGDMDILYTNGDAWDNMYATPSHGVQWLENLGDVRFAYHRLTDMPGAYRALAGDLDLDGDHDILVTAWLPPPVMPGGVLAAPLASIVCLEQIEPGEFVRHTLETGSPYYATFELADFDGDGDLDFALGPGPHVANASQKSHWLAVWWNQTLPGRKQSGSLR